MILYHGSTLIVSQPRILIPNRTLDYGDGFYTTTSEDQARDWARRRITEEQIGFVNIYEFNETQAAILKRLNFPNPPDENWLEFVHSNRTKRGFKHPFDLVYGPVANDRVYAAFALYEQGFLNKHELLKELKTYSLVDQMVFHTEEALKALKFIKAKEVYI